MSDGSENYLSRIKELEKENLLLKNKLEFQELYNEFSSNWEMFRNPAGKAVYISPSFEKITGHSREDFLKGIIEIEDLVHKEDLSLVNTYFLKKSDAQPVSDLIFRILDKGNNIRHLSVTSQPVYNQENIFLGTRINFIDISKFKLIEEALRDSEIKLKSVFDNSIHGIILIDDKGIIVDWNRCLENISGVTKDLVINESIWKAQYSMVPDELKNVYSENDLEQIWKQKIFFLKDNELFTGFGKIVSSSGEIENTEDYINPITIGNKRFYIAFQRYVTRQRKAELALKESEEKYLKAFQTSPYVIILTGQEDRKILEVNDAFVTISGYSREESISKTSKELNLWVNDNDRKDVFNAIQNNKDIRGKEILFRRKDGVILTGLLSSSLIHINSRPIILSSFNDITQRKQAEVSLSSQNQALLKLNNFAVGLSNLALDDNLDEFIARQIKDLTGAEFATFSEYDSVRRLISVKEIEVDQGMLKIIIKILGKQVQSIKMVVTDEIYRDMITNRIRIFNNLFEVSFGSISQPLATTLQTLLRIDRFIALVYLIEGKIYGTTLIGMSKSREDPPMEILKNFTLLAAESLQRKNAEVKLVKKVEELAFVNDKLEKYTFTNQELKQLAFTASHQLQEPIRTITNYTQVIGEDYAGILDEKGLSYLNTIREASNKMSVLISSIIEFSRLGRGKILVYTNCRKLIESVISDLGYLINSSGAEIEVSEMPSLYIYEVEFRQLIQNLLTNAIKFQKKGNKPVIRIEAAKVIEKWRFSVADNGIGIDPEHFRRIFDIFQRLHSTEDEYEGTGIGLAYCKKIIELHQGEIWVDSKPGKGAAFYFTIPNLKA